MLKLNILPLADALDKKQITFIGSMIRLMENSPNQDLKNEQDSEND